MDEKQIEFFKSVAHDQYSIMIREDYGAEGFERLTLLTDTIVKIYRHLDFSSFSRIVIYSSFDNALFLENIQNSPPRSIQLISESLTTQRLPANN